MVNPFLQTLATHLLLTLTVSCSLFAPTYQGNDYKTDYILITSNPNSVTIHTSSTGELLGSTPLKLHFNKRHRKLEIHAKKHGYKNKKFTIYRPNRLHAKKFHCKVDSVYSWVTGSLNYQALKYIDDNGECKQFPKKVLITLKQIGARDGEGGAEF